MRYSIEPRDRIYVKGYRFLPFAKNLGKSLCNKYGQKPLDNANKSTLDAIKTASKRVIQKTAEATGNLIGNKIADKITSISNKKSSDNDDEKENVEITTHKKRYVSPEERQQVIDELRLVPKNYWCLFNSISLKNTLQRIKMEYQKIANLLDNASNQPFKFRTINWLEINDESRGTYTGNNIKFKTTMLGFNLWDYADSYILVKGTITITGAGNNDIARQVDEIDKGITFKNCAPFIKCINRVNNTETDNAKDIDILMPMYNLTEYSDNYSKTSGSLRQYYKDDPNNNLTDSELFKYKVKITGKTPDDGNTMLK